MCIRDRININWALRPAEMITVVVMGLVTTGIPIFMMGFVLSIPTTPYYVASAENQWGTYVLPHLPAWLLPSNEGLAMTWFFEGLPYGEPTPWSTLLDAWAMPLFWWLSFIFTLFFVCFCIVVILRKQWVEHESLTFPLTSLPLAMAEREPRGAFLVGFMNRPIFWVGFGLAFFQIGWGIIGYFVPLFPDCLLYTSDAADE